jgi:hypothetical protein
MKRSLRVFGLCLPFAFAACGDGDLAPSAPPVRAPHVLALSTYEASVGSVIDVHGRDFGDPGEGTTSLRFNGRFVAEDGSSMPVNFEVTPKRVDASTVRWTSFGPYNNPFGVRGNEIGRFEGTIAGKYTNAAGESFEDQEPLPLYFAVKPSIIVHELQPLSASCNGAAKRALGGASYRLRVEAAGFDPASYTYTLAIPALKMPPVAVRHGADGRFDSVGDRGDFTMPAIPEDMQSYQAIISIEAKDTLGNNHQSTFAIGVHRPIEIYYNGNVEVAEVYAPVPVSACIPGGDTGRTVEYQESMEETRNRSYELNWNDSWVASHTVSTGSSETIGLHETNGVGYSTTDEENWNWSLGAEIEGSFGLSKLVSLGLKVSGSVGGGGSHSNQSSTSRETGIDTSQTTTDTEEASMSVGGENGGGIAWEVSSSNTIARGFGGKVVARTFGVFYRQTLRLMRRASIVTYNQCGAANVVGDVDFSDWAWSPDLATGSDCPPLPVSNLPVAQCLIPPCAGE